MKWYHLINAGLVIIMLILSLQYYMTRKNATRTRFDFFALKFCIGSFAGGLLYLNAVYSWIAESAVDLLGGFGNPAEWKYVLAEDFIILFLIAMNISMRKLNKKGKGYDRG